MSDPRRRPPPGRDPLAGVTLAETVVALGLALALLATLVPLCLQATATTLAAHDQSMASMLAAAKLEQLRALDYRFDELPGVGVVRVTDTTTSLAGTDPSSGGSGLGPSPPGTLLRDTPGFVDYLDGLGRWMDADRSGAAAYVRRWAITPLPVGGEDALVLQVLVAPTSVERREGPRVDAARRPGDAWLTLIRARVL